jgi:F-type H+-transporting ATPase subunit alpha
MAVSEQVVLLLVLTSALFDTVPLERMVDAEGAVRKAVAGLPTALRERLETGAKLSEDDRKTLVDLAGQTLESFQPEPVSEAES